MDLRLKINSRRINFNKITLHQSIEYFLNVLISNSSLCDSPNQTIYMTKDEISACLSKQQGDFKRELFHILEVRGFYKTRDSFEFSSRKIWRFMASRQKEICDQIYISEIEDIIERNVGSKKAKTDFGESITSLPLEDEEDLFFVEHSRTIKRETQVDFIPTLNTCLICLENFFDADNFFSHIQIVHGDEGFVIPWKIKQTSLCSGEKSVCKMKLMSHPKMQNSVALQMRNTNCSPVVVLQALHYYNTAFNQITFSSSNDDVEETISTFPISLESGKTLSLTIEHGNLSWQSIILFLKDELKYDYVELFHLKDSRKFTPKLNHFRPKRLKPVVPSDEILKLFNCGFQDDGTFTKKEKQICSEITSLYCMESKNRLNENNYTNVLSHCVQIGDCGEKAYRNQFDLESQEVEKFCADIYMITLSSDVILPPDLTTKDLVILTRTKSGNEKEIEATIDKIRSDYLLVFVKDECGKKKPECGDANERYKIRIENQIRTENNISYLNKWLDKNEKFDVSFKQTRVPIKMEYNALAIVEKEKLSSFMFPAKVPEKAVKKMRFDWFNKNIQSNPAQVQAVTHIVQGTSFPAPYIIFGPPGTGKTSTIVETICQLYKELPNSRVLVTAQSNAACNEFSDRLINYLPKHHFFRMIARSKVDDETSLKSAQLKWKDLYKYRVVICTLCTSGSLQLAGIDPTHFTHLFIDECASATEPSSLISIAGIITSEKCLNGQIILAGDVNQLGPIVRSRFAENLGYGKPLMQRLMELEIYQKDPTTKQYNPRMITKLVYNFRSHPKIIEFSNKSFYEGDLKAKGSKESTNWALNWCHLPNKQFPVIFHPSYGAHRDDKTSLCNLQEIETIEQYIKLLLAFGINGRAIQQTDIGIISPYKRQCQKLMLKCGGNNWEMIEIGTVEAFQGKEKPIIFISTVRSNSNQVGFLNNPKRLNVSLTRAKSLMIIVGNPNTLKHDCYWYDLMKFCQVNGGCATPIVIGQRPLSSNNAANTLSAMFAEFKRMNAKHQEPIKAEDFA